MTVKEIGLIIQKKRKSQGMTQPQLAMACGTGIRFIVDIEAGKETCQIGKVLMVLQMLGISITLNEPK
jgi:y4mF family transcriptional regulator